MYIRLFLILVGLVLTPYGLYCAINPDFLQGFAGLTATTATGRVELIAMYGGLQTSFGILAFLGAARPNFTQAALVATAFLFAGLGLFRLFAAIAASDFAFYTLQALTFEFVFTAIALFLLRPRGGKQAG